MLDVVNEVVWRNVKSFLGVANAHLSAPRYKRGAALCLVCNEAAGGWRL